MVEVAQTVGAPPLDNAQQVADWVERLAGERGPAAREQVARALTLAHRAHEGQRRASGEPYVQHVLAVADILASLNCDTETLVAAILHDVIEDSGVTAGDIEAEFGARVRTLVEGVTRMDVLPAFGDGEAKARVASEQAESLRKMLLAMAEDVRVVLIKLADRLHNMRTISALPVDRQRAIARETLDIFAPLANRLGIWQVKWELEDHAFRCLEPQAYKDIARQLAERRLDREQYIERFIALLTGELGRAGISSEISGRPKHIYSIWRKMQRKHLEFHQVYDMRAVRVLVDEVRDCYAALGIVHTLWSYIPGEFDDYIATPKENNYRSIHTAVVGPEGKTVEIQIRTREMHQQCELGIAAHWRYKESMGADQSFDQKIAWLRQLLEWKDEVADAGEFVDQFKSEVFEDRVYVFTPRGKVVDLPAGATGLDFAYHIHTEIGHRCRGIKANGHIVPLTYRLQTGDRVEVLTVKKGGPSRDWLNPDLGYLVTPKARAKVQAWVRHQTLDYVVTTGRQVLEREFKRLGLGEVNQERLAQKLKFRRVEDMLAAVGRGEIKTAQIVAGAQEGEREEPRAESPLEMMTRAPTRSDKHGDVSIEGVGNLLTHMASCCKPLPGEPIVGYITHGRGITVHRRDCRNVLRHGAGGNERLVELQWGESATQTYPVDIEISAYDRQGLLHDVSAVLSNARINVIAVNTRSDKSRNVARMLLTVEIPDLDALSRVLAQIAQLPNVTDARRRTE